MGACRAHAPIQCLGSGGAGALFQEVTVAIVYQYIKGQGLDVARASLKCRLPASYHKFMDMGCL